MYSRQESEYFRAKIKASRRLGQSWTKPADLPSNAEIRDQVQALARLFEGESRSDELRSMRVFALHLMLRLERFRPRLIGSVLTGHTRRGSDIDIHVFSDSCEAVAHLLEHDGLDFQIERKRVSKQGVSRTYTHIHVAGPYPIELTVYATKEAHIVTKSSITGKPIERASIAELRQFLQREYIGIDLDAELAQLQLGVDRFRIFEALLLPLENVKQDLRYHPEGDALYHSLQVFDHARDQLAYDEEFLLSALLHDVGKAIDCRDHVAAGLEALEGLITERTTWLIAHHMEAHALLDRTISRRAHRRLRESPYYDELLLLGECDQAGRVPGAEAPELDEALDYLRQIAAEYA